jgi:lipoprotein-releasing system permease protein
MVIVVNSVMGGFLDKLKMKARGLLGDIIVDNHATQGMPEYERFIADISSWPEIVKATPVIYTPGLMKIEGLAQIQYVNVVGIRLEEVFIVNAFKMSLYYDRYYPGLTTLEPQRQPLMGFDPKHSPHQREDNGSEGPGLLPILPEPYRSAREKSRAAGLTDNETKETSFNELLKESGGQPVVGVFDLNDSDEDQHMPALKGEEWPGLIIGRDLIAEREADGRYWRNENIPLGAKVVLTVMSVSESAGVDPNKVPFRYVDDSRTGIYEIDSRHVYCKFELIQRYLRMDAATLEDGSVQPARCHQVQIKIADGVNADALAAKLQARYRGYASDKAAELSGTDRRLINGVEAMTWEQSQHHIIGPVEHERQLVTILFGIISIVAIVLVLCILYMIVLQKTRDIGIVKSIGGSSSGVAAVFLCYGAAVGIVGTIVGAAAGWLFVHFINEIQDFLIYAFGWQVWNRAVYSFDEIPNTVRTGDMMMIVLAGIFASTVGALGAAIRAGAMQPVESLRYE